MIPSKLIDRVENFTFAADRLKFSGRMWGGRAKIKLTDNVVLNCQLWHHGADEETELGLKKELSINGVTIDGVYHDAYWYCVICEDAIWVHKKNGQSDGSAGWFSNRNLREHPLIANRPNHNFQFCVLNDTQENELKQLGLEKICF